ncbi:ABC transporter permease [uncultured Corynebacterium sp.]|uniref:ABC transporter permease n=1 Tax=uncultured Corynebacterium sp. TaxID=159447 RepID=UPI0026025C7E|nr:ABC transporter permease [uncultured Corynebacterium sp.]
MTSILDFKKSPRKVKAEESQPAHSQKAESVNTETPKPHRVTTEPAKSKGSRKAKRRLIQVGSLAGLIALWWLVTTVTSINPVVLPSPGAVLHELWSTNTCHPASASSARTECGVEGYFLWQHLLATIERIAVGLIAGTIVGVLLGWLLGSSRTVRAIVEPYLSFLRALPPLGYIGLLIVWFGIGDVSKVVLLFLAVFPTVTVATITGVTGIRRDWILAARTLGARRSQVLRRVIIPGALPEIINGIRLGAGLAWSAIVAAEMNDGIPGIGGLAYISGTQLNTALTIASIIVIGITALIFDQALVQVERRFAPWRGKQ